MSKKAYRSQDDVQLIAACRAGDQEAWDALVDRYSRMVYSVPVRYQLPPEEAADVFQNVWLDLYRDLDHLQKAASLRSWLLTATSRRCLLHKKRMQKTQGEPDAAMAVPDPAPGPQALHQEVEREHLLHVAIEGLPDRCRMLVRVLFFEHPPVPYADVAKRLGLAEGSIGFIRGRCLKKLRERLKELGVDS
ncbi:MAG: sigma-70 family RNA polymerase sigma factor [Bryobacteraceae bacterium]